MIKIMSSSRQRLANGLNLFVQPIENGHNLSDVAFGIFHQCHLIAVQFQFDDLFNSIFTQDHRHPEITVIYAIFTFQFNTGREDPSLVP